VEYSGVSCEGYFTARATSLAATTLVVSFELVLIGATTTVLCRYVVTCRAGAVPDHVIDELAVGAYVTDVTVDVCSHGIYVHSDHCTDPFVVERNERYFRAQRIDGTTRLRTNCAEHPSNQASQLQRCVREEERAWK
jgi:hypothetical protein